MKRRLCVSAILFVGLLAGRLADAAVVPPVPIGPAQDGPIGRYVGYFKETDGRLTLAQAVGLFAAGRFSKGRTTVLNFGIGSKPVWLHFSVANATAEPVPRRLSIETAWLDHVDVYFRQGGKTLAAYRLGDRQPFTLRPLDTRNFAIDHAFAPGVSEVFVRVATPDPMVVPIYLASPHQAHVRARMQEYSYGFLYGFIFALLAYNLMLFAGLRDLRYLLYSVYLGMFLLMNISYTGHGFEWLWPDSTVWAQWSNPVLMVLYCTAGLLFALRFLDMRRHFPRVSRTVLIGLGVILALLLLTVALGDQRDALLLAFGFVCVFTVTMLAMGVATVRSGHKAARYFLLAAVSAMVGATVTAFAVWGVIPFTLWTFRAVDIGMMLDATLLALALTYQVRTGQEAKLRAEQLARLDPLTGVNNRRAFYDIAVPIWNITLRREHALSVILLDIDDFKRINDLHGHACGDEALVNATELFNTCIRDQDVIARWGGEEFLLLLPETDLKEAAALAERLRRAIAEAELTCEGAKIRLTASFGVAQRGPEHATLDTLISTADKRLYRSKGEGRNRITFA